MSQWLQYYILYKYAPHNAFSKGLVFSDRSICFKIWLRYTFIDINSDGCVIGTTHNLFVTSLFHCDKW